MPTFKDSEGEVSERENITEREVPMMEQAFVALGSQTYPIAQKKKLKAQKGYFLCLLTPEIFYLPV